MTMFESKFSGRDPVKKATCPFCGQLVERPKELSTRRPGEMPLGACTCGAVYACDETGHNLGSAMIEALVFASNMDWDLAWGLLPEEDYLAEIVENYDLKSHLIIPSGTYEGRRIAGALYFIRMHKDIQEVTSEGVAKRLKEARAGSPASETGHKGQRLLTKKQVEDLVGKYQVEPILEAAKQDKKVIRYLQRLIYSGDPQARNRAAEILGRACAVVAQKDPGVVSKLLQGLFYSLTDTAAYPMGALETIGWIVAQRPDLFGGYAPQLYQFLGDNTRKAQVLEALARIAQSSPEILRKHSFHFFPFLKDPDPIVRGYTSWLLGNLRASEAKDDIAKLLNESHEVEVYEAGQMGKKSVAVLASEALNKFLEKENPISPSKP